MNLKIVLKDVKNLLYLWHLSTKKEEYKLHADGSKALSEITWSPVSPRNVLLNLAHIQHTQKPFDSSLP